MKIRNSLRNPLAKGLVGLLCAGAAFGVLAPRTARADDPSTNVYFNNASLTNDAEVTWIYGTQNKFEASSDNGTITGSANDFYFDDESTVVTNTPGAFRHHSGWYGETNGCTAVGNVITCLMDVPRTIIASNDLNTFTITVNGPADAQPYFVPGTESGIEYGDATRKQSTMAIVPTADPRVRLKLKDFTVTGNTYSTNSP